MGAGTATYSPPPGTPPTLVRPEWAEYLVGGWNNSIHDPSLVSHLPSPETKLMGHQAGVGLAGAPPPWSQDQGGGAPAS